jgi:hypothetical protein
MLGKSTLLTARTVFWEISGHGMLKFWPKNTEIDIKALRCSVGALERIVGSYAPLPALLDESRRRRREP